MKMKEAGAKSPQDATSIAAQDGCLTLSQTHKAYQLFSLEVCPEYAGFPGLGAASFSGFSWVARVVVASPHLCTGSQCARLCFVKRSLRAMLFCAGRRR